MTLSGIMSGTEDRTVFQSMKNHPRYHLRVTAIVAVALGLFFNTLAIIIAREYVLSGLAFLPLCISMIYHHADLVSKPVFKRDLPYAVLFYFDLLGFLSFLTLLIANGVIATHRDSWYRASQTFLLAYTSVPWLFCCAIHGFIVLQDVPQMQILNFGRLVCAECHRDIKQKAPEYIQRNQYSHVAGEYNPETDVEANNGPNRINLRDDQETSPMRQSSESTTETSRLFTAAEY